MEFLDSSDILFLNAYSTHILHVMQSRHIQRRCTCQCLTPCQSVSNVASSQNLRTLKAARTGFWHFREKH